MPPQGDGRGINPTTARSPLAESSQAGLLTGPRQHRRDEQDAALSIGLGALFDPSLACGSSLTHR